MIKSNRLFARAAGLLLVASLLSSTAAMAQEFVVEPNMPAKADWVSHLPADVKARGQLNVGTTDGMAPWIFFDRQTNAASGVDADIINEAASRLGLKVSWNNIQFATGIPGVESGRYDFYLSAMADTVAREKVVNFIAYSTEGSGVVVPKGNPKNITKMADLCGLRVMVQSGSLFPTIIEKLNKETCKTPIVMSEAPDKAAPLLAIASGQADASMETYGVSTYTFKTATEGVQTQLEVSPVERFAPANQGIAFSKKTPELQAAIAGALQSMVEDGTYQKIFDKWDVGSSAVSPITLNAPLF